MQSLFPFKLTWFSSLMQTPPLPYLCNHVNGMSQRREKSFLIFVLFYYTLFNYKLISQKKVELRMKIHVHINKLHE